MFKLNSLIHSREDKGKLQMETPLTREDGSENAMYLIKSKENYVQTIDTLIAAIEEKDQYTKGHSQRVSVKNCSGYLG